MKEFNLNEYLKNPSQKVVTRDGREVRIICTDRKKINYSIIALIFDKEQDCELCYAYCSDGQCFTPNENLDLFFAPEKREGWININNDNYGIYTSGYIYKSKKEAEKNKDKNIYIATIKIEWEE